jgi:hypothetical protein
MKLKPTTRYTFSPADLEFVLELAKVGHVHLLSSQVSLTGFDGKWFSFKDFGDSHTTCNGLQLPPNWVIEWVGFSGDIIKITFGVAKA